MLTLLQLLYTALNVLADAMRHEGCKGKAKLIVCKLQNMQKNFVENILKPIKSFKFWLMEKNLLIRLTEEII